jgi:hypothetical protein
MDARTGSRRIFLAALLALATTACAARGPHAFDPRFAARQALRAATQLVRAIPTACGVTPALAPAVTTGARG